MRMARPEKVDKVKDITGHFENSEAALLTEYRGLRVSEIAEVRGALRAADAEYKVYKNTLARIAVRDVGLEELVGILEGPTAIAFVRGDAAAAAKALDDAAKKYPVLVIKGGVLNGRVIDAAQANELARLEPRDVQLARVAMLMNAPAQQLVNAFAALLRDLGSMLAQVVSKKESGELPAGVGETSAPQTAPQEVQDENPAPDAEPEAEPANPETDAS
jgi:large subunit ribosomal protein L10